MNYLKNYKQWKINESIVPTPAPSWYKNWIKENLEIPGISNDNISNLSWELIKTVCGQQKIKEPATEADLMKMVKDLGIMNLMKNLGIEIDGPKNPDGLPIYPIEDLIPIILTFLTGSIHNTSEQSTPTDQPSTTTGTTTGTTTSTTTGTTTGLPPCFPDPKQNTDWIDILNKLPLPVPTTGGTTTTTTTPSETGSQEAKDVVTQGVEDATKVADKVVKGDIEGAIDLGVKKGIDIATKILKNPQIFNPNIFK